MGLMGGGGLFFGTEAGELDEFNACGTDRMGPVDGTFSVSNTTGNFIQKI